jgi:hypothetical protein
MFIWLEEEMIVLCSYIQVFRKNLRNGLKSRVRSGLPLFYSAVNTTLACRTVYLTYLQTQFFFGKASITEDSLIRLKRWRLGWQRLLFSATSERP